MTETSAATAALLRALLGDGFAVAAAAPALADEALFAEERRRIVHAAPRRRAEFATVRACARRALAELGVCPCPLVPAADGAPRWPAGVVGALTHADDMCAAAVARTPEVIAVGVDLEVDAPLDPGLEAVVCTGPERRWLDAQAPHARGRLGALVFSAKEAVYKCQSAVTETFLDFADVELAIDVEAQAFRVVRAKAPVASLLPLDAVRGRFGYTSRHLATAAVVRGAPRR